jgi:hypothetical protein
MGTDDGNDHEAKSSKGDPLDELVRALARTAARELFEKTYYGVNAGSEVRPNPRLKRPKFPGDVTPSMVRVGTETLQEWLDLVNLPRAQLRRAVSKVYAAMYAEAADAEREMRRVEAQESLAYWKRRTSESDSDELP